MPHSARTRDLSQRSVPQYPVVDFSDVRNAERKTPGPLAGRRVHMIGIGGCGMRGAAALLLRGQAIVSGSDWEASSALLRLREHGATIHTEQQAANLPTQCDLAVYSAAVKETNPELIEARRRGMKVVKYAELLGMLMADCNGIAVAGTHGKSTTTAMIAYVLREAGKDPSYVIGAGVEQLGGGSGVGDGDCFVVEACEYDRSYLHLKPRIAAILNIEEDHLDYYSGLEDIIESFSSFASLAPSDGLIVANGEDRNAMRAAVGQNTPVETFGFGGDVTWKAQIIGPEKACPRFRVLCNGKALVDMRLSIPGRHNIANALAATAICFRCGVEPNTIADKLGAFRGAYRRLTERGCVAGVTVVDDYGHHPTEIQATLKAAREFYNPENMFVVFQPHQHSRTRFLLNDFARSFTQADVVVVPEIYFVRDSEKERDLIAARDLVERIHCNGGDARHEKDFDKIASQLCREVRPGDLVVTMGAGDVWKIAEGLLECLARTRGEATEIALAGDSKEY